MLQTSNQKQLVDQLLAPAHNALDTCRHQRSCPGLSDLQWLEMGVERSLKECRSGRGFLQDWAMAHAEDSVKVSHFFETLSIDFEIYSMAAVSSPGKLIHAAGY